jgi:hypothetical protein
VVASGLEVSNEPGCVRVELGPAIKPSVTAGTVLTLARHMYDSRDFSAIPILAEVARPADV